MVYDNVIQANKKAASITREELLKK